MAYWWVNQKQTFAHERDGGYLWAPRRAKNGGAPKHHWVSMTMVQPGDVIFSYVRKQIVAVSTAKTAGFDAHSPFHDATGEQWQRDGWRVDASYRVLEHPVGVSTILPDLQPLLPEKYSPLTAAGFGNQGYLFALPEEAGRYLHRLVSGDQPIDDRAYLLTWNPAQWQWDERESTSRAVAAGACIEMRWSCGNTRSIPLGARVYLLRQGDGERGIIGSGWISNSPAEGPHWDEERARRGDTAWYIRWQLDALVQQPLAPELIALPPNVTVHWSPFASGTSIPGDAARAVEAEWAKYVGAIIPPPDIAEAERGDWEGEQRVKRGFERHREGVLREAKIQAALVAGDGRLRCEVPGCAFDFAERYGVLGKDFAHVHHLNQLSHTGKVRTTLGDLAIVCANCHAMIHRWGENRSLETLIPLGSPGQ